MRDGRECFDVTAVQVFFELGQLRLGMRNIEGERFEQEVWLSRPLVGTDGLPGADVKVFIDGCRSWHNGGRLLNGTRRAPRLRRRRCRGRSGYRGGPRSGWQPTLEQCGELGQRKRFGEIVIHAGGETPLTVAFQRIGGEGDDGGVAGVFLLPFMSADHACGGHTVHLWHMAIHEDEIKRTALDCGHRFFAVLRDGRGAAEEFEHGAGYFSIHGIIFRQQNMADERLRLTLWLDRCLWLILRSVPADP